MHVNYSTSTSRTELKRNEARKHGKKYVSQGSLTDIWYRIPKNIVVIFIKVMDPTKQTESDFSKEWIYDINEARINVKIFLLVMLNVVLNKNVVLCYNS